MSDLCSSMYCNVCQALSTESSTSTKQNQEQFEIFKLQKCGGCQLVQYCGAEHQKLDWPIHKDFCCAVQRILKTYDAKHPLSLQGNPPQSGHEMKEAIQLLKMLLPIALKRKVQSHEQELTSFPAYCAVCYSLKRSQYVCTVCRGVSYCSMEHAKQHAADHSKICNQLELYYCRHKTCQMQEKIIPFDSFLRPCAEKNLREFDLIEAIEHSTNVPMPEVPTSSLKDYRHFSFVADFSAIGTICFALAQLKTRNKEDHKMTIFIIGATDEQLHYFRGIHTRFFFLHYPNISKLSISYIGPEVVHDSGLNSQTYKFLGSMRAVTHTTYRGTFEDYMKESNIEPPTMIIAFNCGFSEFPLITDLNKSSNMGNEGRKSPWYDGLFELVRTHLIPIFFTSYTSREAEADYVAFMKVLRDINDADVYRFLNLIPNPYRDIRPLRNWETIDEERIFYRNGYIQGVITEIKERERFI